MVGLLLVSLFFFKQQTAYEMLISDWSSDVCSSDLNMPRESVVVVLHDGDLPSEQAMAPVLERAHEVRYATAAGLPEAIVGADVLFAYDFFSTADRQSVV